MKLKLLFSLLFFVALYAVAQKNDNPVLLTINGKPVTRGEFEYAYNKNNIEGAVEQKSVNEYLDMFINYKLKVAAAEALRMDTLSSFRNEFRTYRDMQLSAGLVDQTFVDSVARSLYDDYAKRVNGQDLLTAAHILLLVPQQATEDEKQIIAQRIDSIYQAIVNGANFAEMAKRFSQDPGTARLGGQLPTLYVGMTLKEFEEQAYALQAGQMSRPFLSSAGYHIVWVKERKPLESYETLYPNILASLKQQGIEEAAADHKIRQLTANGRSREEVMDSTLNAMLLSHPDLKYLIQEYYDGLLLYEVAKQQVWDVAANDLKGMEQRFKSNKKKYAWASPHFKGYIISGKTPKAAQQAQSLLKKGVPTGKDLNEYLKENINKDSILVVAQGVYLVERGENSTIDHLAFGDKQASIKPIRSGFPFTLISGKVLKKPQTFEDVRNQVQTDHQQALESAWVAALRKQYRFNVDQSVLKTVNNHQ